MSGAVDPLPAAAGALTDDQLLAIYHHVPNTWQERDWLTAVTAELRWRGYYPKAAK